MGAFAGMMTAFLLTLFAGLATGAGSAIALVANKTDARLLASALGFSAGVMIYVSFLEMLPQSGALLGAAFGSKTAEWLMAASFFGGILIAGLIDMLVPEVENPHELRGVECMTAAGGPAERQLMRMGVFTAAAIAVHNFPEGLAVFVSGLQDLRLGLPIAAAVAIHNVPEGIAVAVPVYYATGSRRKAFFYSFLSGLSEPLGAVLGFFALRPFMGPVVFGALLAAVAGIMVFISLDELLPGAHRAGAHHAAVAGLVAGMAVMALSLLLL